VDGQSVGNLRSDIRTALRGVPTNMPEPSMSMSKTTNQIYMSSYNVILSEAKNL